MKNTLKISVVSLCCVLFGAGAMNAHGASMVRSLGGGTYSGTTGSTSNNSTGAVTSAARAGTIRTTSSGTKGTVTSGTSGVGSSARLSIGKYLGGGKIQGTPIKNPNPGMVTKPGTSGGDFDPAALDEINKQIDNLDERLGNLDDKVIGFDDALANKQDILNSVSEYIYIEGNDIGLDTDKLGEIMGGGNGREIEFQKTDTEIQWRHVGDATWNTLVLLEDLRGPAGDSGAIDPDVLKAQVDAAIDVAINNIKNQFATAEQGQKADTALQPGDALSVTGAPTDGKNYVPVIKNGELAWVLVVE